MNAFYDWLFSEPVSRVIEAVALICSVAIVLELIWRVIEWRL